MSVIHMALQQDLALVPDVFSDTTASDPGTASPNVQRLSSTDLDTTEGQPLGSALESGFPHLTAHRAHPAWRVGNSREDESFRRKSMRRARIGAFPLAWLLQTRNFVPVAAGRAGL